MFPPIPFLIQPQPAGGGAPQPLDAGLTALAAGSDFVKFTGPATTVKAFALPDADATILVSGGALGTPTSGVGSNLTALNATQLTSGTVPDARFPGTLPAASGVNLTALNASNLASGTVPGARLGALPVVVKVASTTYTIGTTDPNELYGGIIYVTGACTITIPAVAAGASFTVITVGAIAVSVDPNNSDLVIRDGTTQADGEKVTNLSTTGDIAVFSYYDATGWYAATNGWTNGG